MYDLAVRARTMIIHALLVGAGCSYYDSSLLDPSKDAGSAAGASGSAGSAGASEGGVPGCTHAAPPGKPSVVNAGGAEDLVFVLDWLKMADRDLGYDLDKTCTCQGETDSCQEPKWAKADHCDGPDGRDNAAGSLIQEGANLVPGFGDNAWNSDLKAGDWGLIFRVSKYNGLADDDQVELAWYVPTEFDKLWELDGGTMPEGGGPIPKWDGTDVWPLKAESLNDSDPNRPKWVDANAYVSGGVLVGKIDLGEFQASGSLKLVVKDAFVTARLVKESGIWRMKEGLLAGVWVLEDIFKQLGQMSMGGEFLCTDSIAYTMIKGMICKYADIYRSRGTPSSQCDSLSLGLSFTAIAGKLGQAVETTSTANTCKPEADPANDSCDTL